MRNWLVLSIIGMILIFGNGCKPQTTGAVTACISPEVQLTGRCCLDFDENKICDDEQTVEPITGDRTEEIQEEPQREEPTEKPAETEKQTTYTIEMRDFGYSPKELEIGKGDTVLWVNKEDAVPHAVYEINGKFRSERLSPGDSFSFTFTESGTFNFSDQIFNKMMKGRIIVR